MCVCVFVCVFVCVRSCVCVRVCVRERERVPHHPLVLRRTDIKMTCTVIIVE